MENVQENFIYSKKISNEQNQSIITPPNSQYKVYIPATHQESYTFKKDTYVSKFLDHLITKENWKEIINNLDIIMWKASNINRKNTEIKLPKFMIVFSIVSVIFFLVFILTIYLYSVYHHKVYLLYISIICMTVSTILSFGFATYNFSRKIGKFKSLDMIIMEQIDVFFRKLNQDFQNKLNFVYVPNKIWIECNILQQKRKQNINRTSGNLIRKSNGAEPLLIN